MKVQIDRETAKGLLRMLNQPSRDPGMVVADRLRNNLRAALDAPQAQPDLKLAALLDSKWRAGDKPDEILGALAEDYSTYKIKVPCQLREQLLALQHRAIDALDAPQPPEKCDPIRTLPIRASSVMELNDKLAELEPSTTEAIDPDNSRCAIPPAQPESRAERLTELRNREERESLITNAQQPDPREAFETDAAARGLDVTRLGDSYARIETHLRWRGFQAGFAAGRKQ